MGENCQKSSLLIRSLKISISIPHNNYRTKDPTYLRCRIKVLQIKLTPSISCRWHPITCLSLSGVVAAATTVYLHSDLRLDKLIIILNSGIKEASSKWKREYPSLLLCQKKKLQKIIAIWKCAIELNKKNKRFKTRSVGFHCPLDLCHRHHKSTKEFLHLRSWLTYDEISNLF